MTSPADAERVIANGFFSIGSDTWPGVSKLIEECGEVAQVVGKIIGAYPHVEHWDGTNLRQRLEEELADLSAAVHFVTVHCDLNEQAITQRTNKKVALFERWHSEQYVAARAALAQAEHESR